jgi:hypothetical protein
MLPDLKMAELPASAMLKRFSFADHIPMILAADIDNNEVTALFDQMSCCYEILLGGRATLTYSKEIKLLCSLLYNITSIHLDAATSGQDFSGLRLIQRQLSNKRKDITALSSLTNQNGDKDLFSIQKLFANFSDLIGQPDRHVYSPLNRERGDNLIMPVVLSLLPYMISRKQVVSDVITEAYAALIAEEVTTEIVCSSSENVHDTHLTGSDLDRNSNEHDRRDANTDSAHLTAPSSGSSSPLRNAEDAYTPVLNRLLRGETAATDDDTSTAPATATNVDATVAAPTSFTATAIFRRLLNAAIRTHSSAGFPSRPNTSNMLGWLETLHLFQFLRNGRYFTRFLVFHQYFDQLFSVLQPHLNLKGLVNLCIIPENLSHRFHYLLFSFYFFALRLCGVRFRKTSSR